ncbi:MAG: biogenesis of lysosome-related organelles complex-1 subunit 2-domain-containing protein [Benniella sp.]|nr:MAG: biogenesis of lysosome-related organelles complex-1 subunit 2-domain-containing protein [Benniella sp.]
MSSSPRIGSPSTRSDSAGASGTASITEAVASGSGSHSSSSTPARLRSPTIKSPAPLVLSTQHTTIAATTAMSTATAAAAAATTTSASATATGTTTPVTNTTPTPSSSRTHSMYSTLPYQGFSTFTAADAARHLSQEHVTRASQEMFRKIAEYVRSEMLAMGEDYKLLENMNNMTRERYGELAVVAQELMQEVGKLRTTYTDFEPYLARIDEISEQAEVISNIANELDEYTKSLETRLKRIMK